MNMTDARVVATRTAIRDSFFQLLEQKPVSRITVKELCQKSGINRSTFYKHYLDPLDLMEQIEAEMLTAIDAEASGASTDFCGYLIRILTQMQQQGGLFLRLTSTNGDPGFSAKVFRRCYQNFFPRFEQQNPELTPLQRELLFQYLSGGSGGVLSAWLHSGMQGEVSTVAELLLRASAGAVEAAQKGAM